MMNQMLEDAKNASWINFQSWLMDNGDNLKIACNESDKRWLESKGYIVKVSFKCGLDKDCEHRILNVERG